MKKMQSNLAFTFIRGTARPGYAGTITNQEYPGPKKSLLNDWSVGEQWILFPSNLNVALDFVSRNIEILGKQNSLLPLGTSH